MANGPGRCKNVGFLGGKGRGGLSAGGRKGGRISRYKTMSSFPQDKSNQSNRPDRRFSRDDDDERVDVVSVFGVSGGCRWSPFAR